MNETLFFIIAMVFVIGIFDIYIIFKKGKTASISAYLIRSARKFPSIPFLLGFLAGHLFWRMPDKDVEIEEKEEK